MPGNAGYCLFLQTRYWLQTYSTISVRTAAAILKHGIILFLFLVVVTQLPGILFLHVEAVTLPKGTSH